MSFLYFPTTFDSIPLYWWSYVHYDNFQPIALEKPEQTTQKFSEDPQVKIQDQPQNIEIYKPTSTISSSNKAIKQKKKIKKSKKRDTNFSSKTQKENRNYVSILSKTFLTHLANHSKLYSFIDPIIQRYKISITAEIFQQNLLQIFDIKANYIRKEMIQDVLASKICSEQFSLIFRILFGRFLKLQVFPAVFKSNKLTKKVKSKQAKFARKVYEVFFQSHKGGEKQKNSPIHDIQKSSLQKSQCSLKDQNNSSFQL